MKDYGLQSMHIHIYFLINEKDTTFKQILQISFIHKRPSFLRRDLLSSLYYRDDYFHRFLLWGVCINKNL